MREIKELRIENDLRRGDLIKHDIETKKIKKKYEDQIKSLD